MATDYPTSLDSFPTLTDGTDYPKAEHVNNPCDAIEALEAKVGIDGSTVTTSHDYKIKTLEALDVLTTVGDMIVRGETEPERLAAVAAGQYLKSAGSATLPAYGKLALGDTGIHFKMISRDSGTGAGTEKITTGFEPSVVFFAGVVSGDSSYWSVGWDRGEGAKHICLYYPASITEGKSIMLDTRNGYISTKDSTSYTITWSAGVGVYVMAVALP